MVAVNFAELSESIGRMPGVHINASLISQITSSSCDGVGSRSDGILDHRGWRKRVYEPGTWRREVKKIVGKASGRETAARMHIRGINEIVSPPLVLS